MTGNQAKKITPSILWNTFLPQGTWFGLKQVTPSCYQQKYSKHLLNCVRNIEMATDEYIELFLKWTAAGENPQVQTWLKNNGLSTLRMKHGLLITGSRRQIEKVFSVSLENKQLPFELPIPAELLPYVASITVPRPRSYHR